MTYKLVSEVGGGGSMGTNNKTTTMSVGANIEGTPESFSTVKSTEILQCFPYNCTGQRGPPPGKTYI